MPIYEYQCKDCGNIEEAFQKISDDPLKTCKHCEGTLQKLISQSSFHLKGSGWYVTDYGGSTAKKDSSTSDSSDSKTKSQPAASESKKQE